MIANQAMNEEEIRSKLILPFLSDLGFDISEISLETSFSIRLGKSEHNLKGRSDILCKRHGKNLFIIELKNDSVSIAQRDIDQGISYARLLPGNIAPFTIVSNGKVTRIFDSITREELTGTKINKQSSYWHGDMTLTTDVDLRIRYDALLKFVSFSPENLKQFCEKQVQDRMGPIIGKIDDPYAKFIRELYVQRQGLPKLFDEFVASTTSVFAIVGAAGVGKTSVMCSLALQKLKNSFVFFYNAGLLNKSVLEHIAHDLNGVFSGKNESDNILKKLDELGHFTNRDILIFIDAIDESVNWSLSIELSEIALSVRNFNRIKICISCKSSIWGNVLKQNGTYTHLFEELNKTHIGPSVDDLPGFLLNEFSDDEMRAIVPLYQGVFGFKGDITESVFNALKNGFFLRIFSEVYSQKQVPLAITDEELIKKYIRRSFEKTSIESQFALRILSKIGKVLVSYKYKLIDQFHDNGIEAGSLMEKLEFSLGETIPEELFLRNILIRSNNDDSYNIAFYYSKIRDYVVSFHSYKLDQLSDDEFYNILEILFENHIGQSALSFYIKNASFNHKQTLVRFKKDKSLKYVTTYNAYIEKHFKSFKEKFDPETTGDMGILLPNDLLKNDGYALIHLEHNSSEKVQFEEFGNLLSRSFDDSIFMKKGVKRIHGSNKNYLVADQDKIVRNEVFEQLREIIHKGKISVYTSLTLLLEQLSTIVYYYSKQLGFIYERQDYNLPKFELIYPINLIDLKDKIYRFRVTEHYNLLNIDYKLKAQKIEEAITEKVDIPRLRTMGDFPPFEELYTIVEILLNKGIKELQKHHLPIPDISIDEAKSLHGDGHLDMRKTRTLQFSESQAWLYIDTFLKHFDCCYKEFIESSFPTIKDKLPFFKSLPHEYFVYMKDASSLQWGYLGYRQSRNDEVIVNHKHLGPHDDIFSIKECNILHSFSLDQIIHVNYYDRVKTIDGLNTDRLDEFCVIRNWVYKFLKRDMEAIFRENKQ